MTIQQALTDGTAFATPVLMYMVEQLGFECISYEPETIEEYLRTVSKDTKPGVIKRVIAAAGLYTSNLFWQDPLTFNIVCRSLNRSEFPEANSASVIDMAWGVTEAGLLTGGGVAGEFDQAEVFSENIIKYVRHTLKTLGMFTTPSALSFAGRIPLTMPVDDPAMMAAAQQLADEKAMAVDEQVSANLTEMLTQIRDFKINLDEDAAKELNQSLGATA